MNSIENLIQIFSHFPGIGPRQARRFVYYLLTRQNGAIDELVKNLETLKEDVVVCSDCGRYFERKNAKSDLCNICANPHRNKELLMIVQRDVDLESAEKNGDWQGTYFVLGGSVPILEKEPEKRIRIKNLESKIKEDTVIKEIVLAMNWNPEGENTAGFVERVLKPICEKKNIKISHLGKGLSMGTELEYADPDTLKNALRNRN